LAEEAADDLVRVSVGAESVELGHHLQERLLGVSNGTLGVELPLLFQTLLSFEELFAVEVGDRMKYGLARRARISQET
jgi:hypothetical protein